MLVHGDDFVLLADEDAANSMLKLMETAYKVKEVARIGYGSQPQEAVILNRIVRYVPKGQNGLPCMELEADNRHVQLLIDDLVATAKPVDTPRVKHSEAEIWKAYDSDKLNRTDVTR